VIEMINASCYKQRFLQAALSILIFPVVWAAGLISLSGCEAPSLYGREGMVHEMGHEVMIFDLSKTLRIFEMTDTGCIQQVIARDAGAGHPDPTTVAA